MTITFTQLGIRDEIVELLSQSGLVNPTPVQERAIPIVLKGRDVIVQAQTGTGKTLAFVLPILQTLKPRQDYVQALIVTPTRELAIQITSEVKKLKDSVEARVLAAYGGQDVTAQIHKLREAPSIIIATPGRLLDHLRRGTVQLDRLSMLILDEADQMLHMGFLKEVEEIIAETPSDRQTMLFSATMPDNVKSLAANYMRDPQDIHVQGKRITLEGIDQVIIETTDRSKPEILISMLEHYQPYLAVVFCRTKIRAKKLTEALSAYGFNVDELHGDLTQSKREQVMKRFRDARLQILVATDVAARGLDVEGITHVFNYDIPQDAESYIHRIGRTGRAGQTGSAFTFASPRDEEYVQQIQQEIGLKLERREMDNGQGEGEGESRARRSSSTARPRESDSRKGHSDGGGKRNSGKLSPRVGSREGARETGARGGQRNAQRDTGARRESERSSSRGTGGRGDERGSTRNTSRGATGRTAPKSSEHQAQRSPATKPVSGYGLSGSRGTVLASARLTKERGADQGSSLKHEEVKVERPKAAKPVSGYALPGKNQPRNSRNDSNSRSQGRGPATSKRSAQPSGPSSKGSTHRSAKRGR